MWFSTCLGDQKKGAPGFVFRNVAQNDAGMGGRELFRSDTVIFKHATGLVNHGY